jgi:hypothetical protein
MTGVYQPRPVSSYHFKLKETSMDWNIQLTLLAKGSPNAKDRGLILPGLSLYSGKGLEEKYKNCSHTWWITLGFN